MARQERESGVCSASMTQTGWSVADGSSMPATASLPIAADRLVGSAEPQQRQ
jgi:hypothetical protein